LEDGKTGGINMACYIISYDLTGDKRNEYEALYDAIKEYGSWARITESTWAIVTIESPTEIREQLSKHMQDDDRLFVVKSGVAAAWQNVICRNTWLKKNL
jgi:hypothetical protein